MYDDTNEYTLKDLDLANNALAAIEQALKRSDRWQAAIALKQTVGTTKLQALVDELAE